MFLGHGYELFMASSVGKPAISHIEAARFLSLQDSPGILAWQVLPPIDVLDIAVPDIDIS